jgi:hypothetical protein
MALPLPPARLCEGVAAKLRNPLAWIDRPVFSPIPGAVVTVAHSLFPSHGFGPPVEIEAFGRVAGNSVKYCREDLRVPKPHGLNRLVDDELLHHQLIIGCDAIKCRRSSALCFCRDRPGIDDFDQCCPICLSHGQFLHRFLCGAAV